MAYNSPKFDRDKHYGSMSVSHLQKLLKDSETFAEKHTQFQSGWHNEHVHDLKRRIAERIGKPKK